MASLLWGFRMQASLGLIHAVEGMKFQHVLENSAWREELSLLMPSLMEGLDSCSPKERQGRTRLMRLSLRLESHPFKCLSCGKELKIVHKKNFRDGTPPTSCSKSCASKLVSKRPGLLERRAESQKKSLQMKYGVDNISQLESVKRKKEQTCLKHFGVTSPAHSKEIRSKSAKTNLERYGSVNPFGSKQIQEKIRQLHRQRFGVDNPSKSPEVVAKIKETMFSRYGVESSSQIGKFRRKNQESRMRNHLPVVMERVRLAKVELLEPFVTVQFRRGSDVERYEGGMLDDTAYVKYLMRCKVCGTEFRDDVHILPRCPKCYAPKAEGSRIENQYREFLMGLGYLPERMVIERKEADMAIVEKSVAFEVNGSYYHSAEFRKKLYHSDKTTLFCESGISLYHIWDYNDVDKVKNLIKSKLGLFERKVFARKTEMRSLSPQEACDFIDPIHLHGMKYGSGYAGLSMDGNLLCVAVFSDRGEHIELDRFCVKPGVLVVGGLSRLVSLAHSVYRKPIMTYANRDWTPYPSVSGYAASGFRYLGDSGPILKYTKGGKIFDRRTFQKHKLKDLFPDTYNDELDANTILHANGYHEVWNSGNHKFVYEG